MTRPESPSLLAEGLRRLAGELNRYAARVAELDPAAPAAEALDANEVVMGLLARFDKIAGQVEDCLELVAREFRGATRSPGAQPEPTPPFQASEAGDAPLRRGAPVSLLVVADRLDAIAHALASVPGVASGLTDELHVAAHRCWAVFYQLKVSLTAMDSVLCYLGQLRDQLGREALGEEVVF